MDLNHESILKDELRQFAKEFQLSDREAEVLHLLVLGYTSSEAISRSLGISPNTTNNHVKSILDKTKSSSKTELLANFVKTLLGHYSSFRLLAKKPRVLVVDDSVDTLHSVSKQLTHMGCKVFIETDPEKVMQLLPELHVDFLITDISMPDMNGFELLKLIRQTYPFYPVIFMMSGRDEYTKEDCLHEGAAAFFNKPVEARYLYHAILEHFIDSAYDKSRFLRAPCDLAATAASGMHLKIGNLGYGGAFIPVENDSMWRGLKVNVGDAIDFSFSLADYPRPIQVLGEVVWKRPKGTVAKPAGMGVRFKTLAEDDRDAIYEYVRLHKIRSFIPSGETGAAR